MLEQLILIEVFAASVLRVGEAFLAKDANTTQTRRRELFISEISVVRE